MALKPIKKQPPAPKPKRMSQERKINIKLKPFVPHEVVQPPQTPTMLRGLSLKELIEASDPARLERANYVVHIETIKRLRTGKARRHLLALAFVYANSIGHHHHIDCSFILPKALLSLSRAHRYSMPRV